MEEINEGDARRRAKAVANRLPLEAVSGMFDEQALGAIRKRRKKSDVWNETQWRVTHGSSRWRIGRGAELLKIPAFANRRGVLTGTRPEWDEEEM